MKARRIGVEFPDEIRRRLCGGDPRFAAFPDGFEGVDSARTVQWLLPALKDCRLCVMVAGDFVPEQALAALQSTFGALSARDPWKSALPFPKLPPVEPGTQTLRAKFTTAQVAMALPFPFAESRDDAVNAQLLMDLMQLRLRALFRSRLSAAYSPLPVFWSQPDLSQNWLLCPVRCESARIAEISGELHQLLDEVRQGKWSADEFQRVARPAGHSLARTLRDPEQWTRLPELVAVRPPLSALKPELLLTREAALKRLAAQVCQPASGIEFRLLPAEE